MTNVIDLDEPHLKREGMIQGQIGGSKSFTHPWEAT